MGEAALLHNVGTWKFKLSIGTKLLHIVHSVLLLLLRAFTGSLSEHMLRFSLLKSYLVKCKSIGSVPGGSPSV